MGRCAPLIVALMLLAASPSRGLAQADLDADPEYERLVTLGLSHFEGGRWQQAHDAFAAAHVRQPNARTLRGMAMASFNLERFARARGLLVAALADSRKPLTPAQQAHATQLLEQARARTARFVLRSSPADASVREAEGQFVGADGALYLEPGLHVVELDAAGHRPERRDLHVTAGDEGVLEVSLQPIRPAQVSAPAKPHVGTGQHAHPPRSAATATEAGDSPLLPALLLGGGAALVTGGLVAAIAQQNREHDIDEICPDRLCPAAVAGRARSAASAADDLALATDLLVGAGLITAGIGAALLLSDRAPAEGRGEAPAARLWLDCRPAACGVAGVARF